MRRRTVHPSPNVPPRPERVAPTTRLRLDLVRMPLAPFLKYRRTERRGEDPEGGGEVSVFAVEAHLFDVAGSASWLRQQD